MFLKPYQYACVQPSVETLLSGIANKTYLKGGFLVTSKEHVSQVLEIPLAPDSPMPIGLSTGLMSREHVLGFQDFSSAPDNPTPGWTKASD